MVNEIHAQKNHSLLSDFISEFMAGKLNNCQHCGNCAHEKRSLAACYAVKSKNAGMKWCLFWIEQGKSK